MLPTKQEFQRFFAPMYFLAENWFPQGNSKKELKIYLRELYRYELMTTGITINEFAKKYAISCRWLYRNCKPAGGFSGLIREYWRFHRINYQRHYQPRGISPESYIQTYGLKHKTAQRQLTRRQLSPTWQAHLTRFHRDYKPQGYSVANYAREHQLCASTARRYLNRFVDEEDNANKHASYLLELKRLQANLHISHHN